MHKCIMQKSTPRGARRGQIKVLVAGKLYGFQRVIERGDYVVDVLKSY